MRSSIYLDHHATTPVDPRVVEAMLPYLTEHFGNPSSKTHPFGWRAQEAVEVARKQVADLIGASPKEIVYTSGATESNNLAILGSTARAGGRTRHVITQATEHHAVLDPIKHLKKQGFEASILRPDSEGRISPRQIADAIRDDTVLVSVMAAQNEVGTIQPIAEIGKVCRDAGVLFHTDAAQAAGRIPLDVGAMNIDLLSISSHKFYGPKGVGILYVRRRGGQRIDVAPSAFGGGQEGGLRPGTLNVPGIVAIAEACRIAREELDEETSRLRRMRDRLLELVREGVPDVVLNGPASLEERLPGNLSLSFHGVDGTALLLGLQDIAASSGSACTGGNAEPSYVLKAMGVSDGLAAATLRLCVGRFNTDEEIEYAGQRISMVASTLQAQPR